MIRDRFPAARSITIVAWVAVLVGWMTALIAKVGLAQPADMSGRPGAPVATDWVHESPSIPAMPVTGLLVIRQSSDAPRAVTTEPAVQTVVVTRVVPASQPPQTTSSGS